MKLLSQVDSAMQCFTEEKELGELVYRPFPCVVVCIIVFEMETVFETNNNLLQKKEQTNHLTVTSKFV